jgi:hypothetical protein
MSLKKTTMAAHAEGCHVTKISETTTTTTTKTAAATKPIQYFINIINISKSNEGSYR